MRRVRVPMRDGIVIMGATLAGGAAHGTIAFGNLTAALAWWTVACGTLAFGVFDRLRLLTARA